MNAEERIEFYQHSIVDGRQHDADIILGDIEKSNPKTEAEWRSLRDFFLALPSIAWADIMTLRFLEVEPSNIPARIARARYLSGISTKRSSALHELDMILRSEGMNPSHYIEMADIASVCGDPNKALSFLKQAIRIDPDDVYGRTIAAHYYMNVQDYKSAKAEILKIRALAGSNVQVISTAMLLAVRLGDQGFVLENLNAALKSVPRDDHATNGWLITVAARLSHPEPISHLMETINFEAITNVVELENIYRAIEGLGFLDHERVLICHALSLDAGNKLFLDASRRLDHAMTGLFPKSGGSFAPVHRRGILSWRTKDWIRELFFWR